MTKTKFQIVEMLGRVVAFGEAYAEKFPKTSLFWPTLNAIRAAISKTYEMSALQDRRGIRLRTDAKHDARATLNAMLEAIHQTSVAVAIDLPQADLAFRLPAHPRRDGDLLKAGEQFAQHAEPLKSAFLDHQLPDDFIDKLQEAVVNLQQAIDKQCLAKNDRIRASAQIAETVASALTDLQRVESIVRNTLRNDSAALAAWETARYVNKVRKSKTKAANVAAPAGEEAAIAASS